KLVGGMVEKLLEKEMEDHLGYEKHSSKGNLSGNSRNGKTKKTVHGSQGDLAIEVPRDRNGEFEPKLIKKRETHISSFDNKIISMYARGMTTRDIQSPIKEIYGGDISPTMISKITDKVIKEFTGDLKEGLQSADRSPRRETSFSLKGEMG
ncbi:MAG: transposase, partial [Simkaniaceae bacterium]|nr:transposase [Simkaniaceae bacterium]